MSALYTASCNPARRAKQSRSDSSLPQLRPREQALSNLKTTATSSTINMPPIADPVTPTASRKPTSRAAREAQRKLNHSIIEKVRRTKINEALAMLRAIVPVDYAQERGKADNTADAYDDDQEEPADDSRRRKRRMKACRKKEEKEKEYKLEILVRTVTFVQDLLEKVSVMESENAECAHCGRSLRSPSSAVRKRKRSPDRDDYTSDPHQTHPGPKSLADTSLIATSTLLNSPHRLPSISSWLPLPHVDPSHLPSPPSSTLVDPVKPAHLPPLFSLDRSPTSVLRNMVLPGRTPAFLGLAHTDTTLPLSPARTPEDESAASLLLQIRNSPPSVPTVSSNSVTTTTSSSLIELPEAAKVFIASTRSRESKDESAQAGVSAHTPSSMLGLNMIYQKPIIEQR